jgi:DNA polymerase-2
VRKSQLTGLALDRVGGSVAAFDFLYLPRLHRCGYVADTNSQPTAVAQTAPGGLVLDSTPGFYRNVAIFDFKSLYPSIIRTFQVDPLAANVILHDLVEDLRSSDSKLAGQIVKGPAGLEFAEDFAILPSIIGELWQERENAKQLKDSTLSQAVKIIMNSFYGVLGTPGCRFYDPRLAGTITRIGHWILIFSREFIESEGHQVIYGDTDSLFIHFGEEEQIAINQVGIQLSERLNCFLNTELQVDLFTLLFKKSNTPDLKDELCDMVRSRHKQLYDGKLDDKLVYKKGISKRLEEYTKNIPPHVRAARMLDQLDGRIVSYVMTTTGPEPVQKRSNAAYDYRHYSEKQLAPIADTVLRFFDLDYRSLIIGGKQLNLF